MSPRWRITITSPPDRELLVADIIVDGVQMAEINEENGPLAIEVYPHPETGAWLLPFDELCEALNEARRRLSEYKQRETVN